MLNTLPLGSQKIITQRLLLLIGNGVPPCPSGGNVGLLCEEPRFTCGLLDPLGDPGGQVALVLSDRDEELLPLGDDGGRMEPVLCGRKFGGKLKQTSTAVGDPTTPLC